LFLASRETSRLKMIPGPAQADIGDQLSEPAPARRRGTRAAQIIIDHHDLIPGPAQRLGPAGQVVLPVQALGVAGHLRQRRLPDVDIGIPPQVHR
jgi:hypothetical protein